jgi:hypothetical protein
MRDGAWRRTRRRDPPAPDAAKNIWRNRTPIAEPEVLKHSNHDGKIVADTTVRREVITREERFGQIAPVMADPIVTRHDAVATEYAIDDVVIEIGFPALGRTISSSSDDSEAVNTIVSSLLAGSSATAR